MGLDNIVVPLVTPLTEDGRIDVAGLKKLLEHIAALGVKSVIILGKTGECLNIGMEQKERLIWEVMKNYEGDVLVCIADNDHENVLDLAHYAGALGADGIVAPPFPGMPLEEHYGKVVSHGRHGMHKMLYNNPAVFPEIPLEFLRKATWFDSIKDSSSDWSYFCDLIAMKAEKGILVYQGDEKLFYISRVQGADGGVPSTGNFALDICRRALTDTSAQAELSKQHNITYPKGKAVQGAKYILHSINICKQHHTLETTLTRHEKAAITQNMPNIIEIT